MSSRATRLLIVDDDRAMREVLKIRLAEWGYAVDEATDGRDAKRKVADFEPDVVISDVMMPGLSGLELLAELRAGDPHRPVLMITSHGTVDRAVEAIKAGAEDFLTKPLDYSKLRSTLEQIERHLASRRGARQLASSLDRRRGESGDILGDSPAVRELRSTLAEYAATDAPVLITGESGTGKELAARAIHRASRRAEQPFVAINAAAIPAELMESEIFGHDKGAFTGATDRRRGCFELADRGTLLLDEVAEMPIALQPKLLRVLEDGRVRRLGGDRELELDVRVLAATNREPLEAVEEGTLREDLYYRLNVLAVRLPPLRERSDDVPLLAQHFLEHFNRRHGTEIEGLSAEALELLEHYPWPGNVRELRNVIERTVVLARGAWIEPPHLPPYLHGGDAAAGAGPALGMTLAEAEKALILATLEEAGHNKAETARRLGIAAKTLYNKLKSYEEG